MSPIKPSIILYKRLLLQSLRIHHKEQGFTLIELLAAMTILTIVVGMTGTGLVFIMSTNAKSDRQITQQSNLRRAADFIADEIKSSSVTTTTYPKWIPNTPSTFINEIKPSGTSPSDTGNLYLEIPMPIVSIANNDSSKVTTFTVENHGLTKGNVIRFSGTGFPSDIDNTTTYFVTTPLNANSFTAVKSDNTTVVYFNKQPLNFALRRLVAYYTVTSDKITDKGKKALYRATGNCAASSGSTDSIKATTNCLVMIDSLDETNPFKVDLLPNEPLKLTLRGLLCTPATIENDKCPTPIEDSISSISMIAIPRATLK